MAWLKKATIIDTPVMELSIFRQKKRKIYKDVIADTQVEVLEEGVEQFLDPNAQRLKGAISLNVVSFCFLNLNKIF